MNTQATSGRRVAGWAGLLAAPLGLFNIASFLSVAGGDTAALLEPSFALALPSAAQALFTASMIADALGFYVLPAMLGAYLATRLSVEHRGRAALALPCLLIYALLGIIGALAQMAALPALAAANAAGAAGAAPVWAAIASVAQGGLWWFEMLPFALFALLFGPALRAAKLGFGSLLIVGGVLALAYWAFSIPGAGRVVPGAAMGAELAGICALLVILAWAFLTGWTLLRRPTGPVFAATHAGQPPQLSPAKHPNT